MLLSQYPPELFEGKIFNFSLIISMGAFQKSCTHNSRLVQVFIICKKNSISFMEYCWDMKYKYTNLYKCPINGAYWVNYKYSSFHKYPINGAYCIK